MGANKLGKRLAEQKYGEASHHANSEYIGKRKEEREWLFKDVGDDEYFNEFMSRKGIQAVLDPRAGFGNENITHRTDQAQNATFNNPQQSTAKGGGSLYQSIFRDYKEFVSDRDEKISKRLGSLSKKIDMAAQIERFEHNDNEKFEKYIEKLDSKRARNVSFTLNTKESEGYGINTLDKTSDFRFSSYSGLDSKGLGLHRETESKSETSEIGLVGSTTTRDDFGRQTVKKNTVKFDSGLYSTPLNTENSTVQNKRFLDGEERKSDDKRIDTRERMRQRSANISGRRFKLTRLGLGKPTRGQPSTSGEVSSAENAEESKYSTDTPSSEKDRELHVIRSAKRNKVASRLDFLNELDSKISQEGLLFESGRKINSHGKEENSTFKKYKFMDVDELTPNEVEKRRLDAPIKLEKLNTLQKQTGGRQVEFPDNIPRESSDTLSTTTQRQSLFPTARVTENVGRRSRLSSDQQLTDPRIELPRSRMSFEADLGRKNSFGTSLGSVFEKEMVFDVEKEIEKKTTSGGMAGLDVLNAHNPSSLTHTIGLGNFGTNKITAPLQDSFKSDGFEIPIVKKNRSLNSSGLETIPAQTNRVVSQPAPYLPPPPPPLPPPPPPPLNPSVPEHPSIQRPQLRMELAGRIEIPDKKCIKVNGRSYQRISLAGKGGSSRVYKVLSDKGRFYAIKKVTYGKTDHSVVEGYKRECELLRAFKDNPHVVQLYDYELNNSRGYLFMVLEYGEIDLARLLQKHGDKPLSINFIRMYWEQMLSAVNVVHKMKTVHSDLKPANFLLIQGVLKLIDFGIAKTIGNDTTNIHRDQQLGTLNYMAPEAIEMFSKGKNVQLIRIDYPKYRAGVNQVHIPESDPNNPAYTKNDRVVASRDLVDLIKSCLERDPKKRPTIPELLNHSFLSMQYDSVHSISRCLTILKKSPQFFEMIDQSDPSNNVALAKKLLDLL
ncbi:Serine/threonine-protein kinase mph1 [Zancudomyces culisetae]|uniref:Serine/threonine-protein kinase mph1 n=1 Tax=Zancudomyces culisetae TaxID=1213189 RepID=A0A1R1PSR9_ZANCU|nr:Serine/threonine-protein kinase mph1 [Zancudomyces culisetae]|eukprot:OMH84008.1 Serine/threonine-protein kinase mph1 [Zancudomyces culisetae]